MKFRVTVFPLVVLTLLQLGGCSRQPKPEPLPPSGGTYISTSAGAYFDQSVKLKAGQGNIASFALFGAHRPSYEPGTVYIAAGGSGIVKSTDGGQSWEVWKTPLSIASDVVGLANGVVVAAGTDSNGQGYVIRTIDSGKNWETVLTVPVPIKKNTFRIVGSNPTPQAVVVSIAPDEFNPEKVWAGTNMGNVLVGEQSGKTWRKQYTLSPDIFGSSNLTITDIIPSPHQPGEIMVLTGDAKLFRVTDKQQQEVKVPSDLGQAKGLYASNKNKPIRSFSYINKHPRALFVGVADGAVLSKDDGQNWQQLDLPVDSAQGFNTVVVTASPSNPARLLVGINSVIYRSEDGGDNWVTFPMGLANNVLTAILIDPSNASKVLAITTPLKS